ncbi:MAG TPA: BamA/TamA family outer membrane protein, partial [Bacteroidota bacterium]
YETGDFARVEVLVHEYPDTTLLVLEAAPFPVLRTVTFEGNSLIPDDSLNQVFAELLGKPINAHNARNSIERLLEVYRRRGYSLARVSSVDFDAPSGMAHLKIDEGVVTRRTIIGTSKTKDYVIWRELPWDEGEVFQVGSVAQGLNNLYGTNLFEQISIKPRRVGSQNQEHLVIIDVRERHTDLLRLGMTVDNERNIQPSIDLRDENFLGIGSELGVHFFGGLRNRYYLGEFKANRIFNSYLTFNLKAYYDLRDVNVFKNEDINPTRWNRVRSGEYREVHRGVSVAFGTQLERLGLVTIEVRTEQQRAWSIFETPIDTAIEHSIGALKVGTRVDSRDRFPYPKSGVVMEFSYESGLVRGGDPVGFTKMFFDYEWYETLFPRQTIRPKILFGFGDETVPFTEQFRLGGRDNFFGYREDNDRGRQLFLLSLQYRYQLPVDLLFETYLMVRYDLGHIWEKAEQIRIKDLRHGLGFTLGVDTPIGPAEVSVGRAFFIRKDLFDNPLSYGPIVTYFKIGYAF